MYVLAKLVYRYETTDTQILYISKSRVPLEELILSIWEDTYYEEFLNGLDFGFDEKTALQDAKRHADGFADCFKIVYVPMIAE